MDKDFKMVKSVYTSNYDAITNIMHLYNIERFDLDCTYSKGSFWKDLPGPVYKTDLIPANDTVVEANSENLPFEDGSMRTIMYDPPFVVAGSSYKNNKEGSSIIAKRFEGYTNYKELTENYYNTLKELYRVCQKGGYVVMKCQDTVSGGKNHFTHCLIMNMAMEIGFYPRDMFILHNKVRINSFGTKWTKQEHARKYHSYYWVFEKVKPRVKYDFMTPIIELDSEEFPNT
jgi:hypothetical protein